MVPVTFIWWIYHFWARFWPYFNFVDFRAYFGPFSHVNRVEHKNLSLNVNLLSITLNFFLRLNCILQDLFRDTPHDHIARAQICTQICQIWPNMPNMHIWVQIWARAIWSSGVSLKRSCKMQFRRIGLRSIGPSSQKLWPNQIFGRFPHCNYNVKLKIAARMSCMGL